MFHFKITSFLTIILILNLSICKISAQEDDHEGHDHTGHDHTPKAANEAENGGKLTGTASSFTHSSGHGLFFTAGTDATVLFSGFTTSNGGSYFGALVVTFLLGVLIEFITTYRVLYPHSNMTPFAAPDVSSTNENARTTNPNFETIPESGNSDNEGSVKETAYAPTFVMNASLEKEVETRSMFLQAFLYAIGVAAAYCLMLIVMTFNVGLFFSAVSGLTTGYAVFGMAREGKEESAVDCCHSVA